MIAPLADSALALRTLSLAPGLTETIADAELDSLLFVSTGSGVLSVGESSSPLRTGSAALVLAGEEATIEPTDELELVVMTVGASTDLHAPMGKRELVVSLDDAEPQQATGARSFQLLFGPHNGSTRATLFAGYVPPGKAPWHYHLYDEIVFVPAGPGRLHLEDDDRGARRRLGLPAAAAAGAHRREPGRRRDDDHRCLHARRQPVCRVPRASDRRRVPLRRVAHGPLDPGRLERRAPAPRAGDGHLGRGSRSTRTSSPNGPTASERRSRTPARVSSTPSRTTTRRCSRCTTSGSSTSCEPPGPTGMTRGYPTTLGSRTSSATSSPRPGFSAASSLASRPRSPRVRARGASTR